MGKQPYIPFYLGDYLKDTRILPLNVRGGWVDLILYMWDNPVKGELIGNIDDFARLMTCSKEEAILVIQTLNQKKIFDYAELPNGVMKIESRKIKSMAYLSEMRKKIGSEGGNPALIKKKKKNTYPKKKNLVNQKPEYENKDEVVSVFIKIGKDKILCTPSFWLLQNKESAIEQYMMKNAKGILLTDILAQLDSEYTCYDFEDYNHVFNSFKTVHKKLLNPQSNGKTRFEQNRDSLAATGAKFREDFIRISNIDEQQSETERDNAT